MRLNTQSEVCCFLPRRPGGRAIRCILHSEMSFSQSSQFGTAVLLASEEKPALPTDLPELF
jgi:hypothetical protein